MTGKNKGGAMLNMICVTLLLCFANLPQEGQKYGNKNCRKAEFRKGSMCKDTAHAHADISSVHTLEISMDGQHVIAGAESELNILNHEATAGL